MIETVYEMWTKLKTTSSTLKKLEILKSYENEEDVKNFFFYTLNDYNYGIKNLKDVIICASPSVTFSDMTSLLEELRNREFTGNAAIKKVLKLLSSCDKSSCDIFLCMLQKKTRCGVSVKLVNKVWPNLIVVPAKLMKARPYSQKNFEHIEFPAISQRKCDGARCLAIKKDGSVKLISSSSNEYYNLNAIKEEVNRFGDNVVLDGELLVVDSQEKVLSRKEGNGILNQSLHDTISEEDADKVRYVIWDIIPIEDYEGDIGTEAYYKRFYKMTQIVEENDLKRISVVESKIVDSKEEALSHFREMIARGEEGTILKNLSSVWENKKSKNCVKFKIVLQSTLKMIEFIEGSEKYTNSLGAILCESSEGNVQVKVGSGFSDADRKNIWQHRAEYRNKFIEIESNGIILAEDGTYSLFLPRFVEIREDKLEADSYEIIKELSDGSQMLMN